MSRLPAILAAVAILLSGCAAEASPPSPPATAAHSPAAASPTVAPASPEIHPSPSSAASPSVGPSAPPDAVAALPAGDQPIYPGTYAPQFQPPLTLTVGREVERGCALNFKCRGDVNVNLPGWLGVGFGDPAFEMQIERFDKVFDPRHQAKQIDPPRDLASWVERMPGVTLLGSPKRVRIGGRPATQIDLLTGEKVVEFAPMPDLAAPASFAFGPHDARRVIVVNVHGHRVLVIIGVVSDTPQVVTPEQLKAASEFLQPLVDSIAWQ